jgi:hypothetical protein
MAERESLFDALDLPYAAHHLQNAYWKAKSEWEALDAAYHAALHDLLKRLAVPEPSLNRSDDSGLSL